MAEPSQKNITKPKKRLGEILVEQGVITEGVLRQALAEQKVTTQRLGEVLIERGWATAEKINLALAHQMEIETVNLADYVIEARILALVKESDARKFKVLPLVINENILAVAMANPNDVFAIDQLQRTCGLKIQSFLAPESDISWAIEQHYKRVGTVEEILANIDAERLAKGEREQEELILRLVELLVTTSVHNKASDIHVEPEKNVLNVRIRLDGILHKQYVLPKALQNPVVSRIKILSGLDISEKRLPQDGRIRMLVESKEIDFRVSTCPTAYGENTVLRILDKSGLTLGLETLGFPERDLKVFTDMYSAPYGIILVTGPTGSGKTTTLYSVLQKLNREEVNVLTVEDPVEYQFHGMRQVQVNPKIGLTFAAALRSFLRQDPNIIMVGEIRDLETAEIAVQAALTGHLVLSTLHTNDAPTAFTRLIDMGVEPFLVSSSLLGVLAQRLVRKVCQRCREEYVPSEATLRALKYDSEGKSLKFARGKGCKFCNNTGYRGRIGIYELLRNTPTIQDMVLKKTPTAEIRVVARKEGMVTLREAAIEKLLAGITSIEEIFRVTQDVEL